LVNDKYNGFTTNKTVKNLILAVLKNDSVDFGETITLIKKLLELPELVNDSFFVAILKELKARDDFVHFSELVHLKTESGAGWKLLLDWCSDLSCEHPDISNALESLDFYRNQTISPDPVSKLYNYLVNRQMRQYRNKSVNPDFGVLDRIFDLMKEAKIAITT